MHVPEFEEIIEPNDQTQARLEHLNKLRELTGNAYPNKFVRSTLTGAEDTISAVRKHKAVADVEAEMAEVRSKLAEGERPPSEVKDAINERLKALGNVRIAGRLTTPPRGNFVHLTDGMSKLQIYCKKGQFALVKNDAEGTLDEENAWAAWGVIDHGDFVGVDGYLFVTNTCEVSVHVEKLQFLAKAMLPMPDKMHGIEDPEIKQRQRYVDLIGSSLAVEHEGLTTREVFEMRAKTISSMRNFLEDHGYVEVETPMLTPKATGAAAKPFETHHNALDIKLYARIAPELYLKRLVVGGFEKVYELNRNFRNEGISYKHNPEFTMLEFYCAYMDVEGMMDFCEELMQTAVQKATGVLAVRYESREIDFNSFRRITMIEAIHIYAQAYFDSLKDKSEFDFTLDVRNLTQTPRGTRQLLSLAHTVFWRAGVAKGKIEKEAPFLKWFTEGKISKKTISILESIQEHDNTLPEPTETENAQAIEMLFELIAEQNLVQPAFIIDFPKSISPLSKASPENPQIAERFELFINGMEVANGFSELNDPKEQYERFVDQMAERERGDEEAMMLDEDYIRALSYGMPPAAGIGIGIDRLVMLLTNKHSIRDVILFPHMRPERREAETGSEGDA